VSSGEQKRIRWSTTFWGGRRTQGIVARFDGDGRWNIARETD
jgi:hypothetical protein